MNGITTDPTDPRLTRGVDSEPVEQASAYLVLSEADIANGFVRPLRKTYIHVGIGGHEIDPTNPRKHGRTGDACGAATTMHESIAKTYAANPSFYGATYCVGCSMHLPVQEFVWNDGTVVGS